MKETKRDSGYAWVILCICFFNNFIVGTIFTSLAVFMIEWTEYYDTDSTHVTVISSLFASLALFTGVFTGPLVNRFGCNRVAYAGATILAAGYIVSFFANSIWWLTVTYGVVIGIGEGLIFNPPLIMIQYYFDKKRPVAAGVALVGKSMGGFTSVPALTLLIQHFGWRGCMFLCAGLAIQMYVLGNLFIMPNLSELTNRKAKKTKEDKKDLSCLQSALYTIKHIWNVQVLKNIVFIQFLLAIFFGDAAHDYMFKFTALKAVERDGMDKLQASLLPFIAGLTATISRLLTSFIANFRCVNRTILCGMCLFLEGVLVTACCFAWDFDSLAIFMALYGILYGCFTAIETTTMVDLIGIADLADAQSFRSVVIGISLLLSMSLAGIMTDATGNYDLANYVYGPLQIWAGVLMLTIPLTQRCIKNRNSDKTFINETDVKPNCESDKRQDNGIYELEN